MYLKYICTCIFVLLNSLWRCTASSQVLVYSLISWGELRGNVTFSWPGPGSNVTVEVNLEHVQGGTTSEEPVDVTWAVHGLPVRYDVPNRCHRSNIGSRLIDLTSVLGKLKVPSSSHQIFETDKLKLVGEGSIWGRSIVLSVGSKTACANLQGVGEEQTFEARFYSPIGGSIWFRTWSWTVGDTNGTEMTILSDIFNTFDDKLSSSNHEWNMYITDILDGTNAEYRSSCNFLSTHYDFMKQSICQNGLCSYVDFTNKFGKLLVSSSRSKISKKFYHSPSKPFVSRSGPRQLYIGIEDSLLKNHVYACARLRPIKTKKAKAIFSSDGVEGEISIEQSSVFSPSELTLDLKNLRRLAGGFHVHELPIESPSKPHESTCGQASGHYNPYGVDTKLSPPPGTGSHDQYELGDLSGKHGMLLDLDSISASVLDYNLPMFGPRSVVGRSIVIHKGGNGSRWVCANLRLDKSLIRAVATFRYPLVGEIVVEQEEDDPLADSTVIVGPLLYSDGSHNDTNEHEWYININLPDKDFYDWRNRCVSAGPHYNPYKISTSESVYKSCGIDNIERCFLGDMSGKHGHLNIAGSASSTQKTRRIFTDTNMPLSGPYTIFKHSFVLEDKHAPKHRGNRLGCTGIFRRFRYKGVVNTWTSSDKESDVEGKIEFIQESHFDPSNVEVDLWGLKTIASGFHVHMVPFSWGLIFPCEASTLYGHFNPLNISNVIRDGSGTDDQYEVGDLSGKYEFLDQKESLKDFYNDTNLPLFGLNSVIGRSVLIHKREKSERWFCGNIAWGYAPSEARQVAAIASFHHPKGYAWGYIRLRQLVYNDGSMSETSIEVNLRHPGTNNKNQTRGHNWSVFVNPVGVDAAVKFFQSRCVAAGYRWNPFLIQLAHPNDRDYYDKQCSPDFPLRCDAGDISGRLGPIDIGDKKFVFMDKNLPLAGEHSAMGKAIVIHNERGRVENFACGNILPDEDIVKWVNVRRTDKFSVSIFMYDMRKFMNCPEWFLAVDYRSVKNSKDNQCISFKVFFTGPYAKQLELDFSRLLAGGILEKPTIAIPGVYPDPKREKRTSYKSCGGLEEDDINKIVGKGQNWWSLASYGSSATSRSINSFILNLLPILIVSMVY